MTDVRHSAGFAVIVLTTMNLLNYVDRWVPSAVKPLFQRDLGLSDAETSLPFSAFVVVYMLASPVFGALAERGSRPRLIAFGVALWSLATAAGSFATGFVSFLVARALVGVGEAAYATISPTIIADHYAPERRNTVLTLFYVATPVGAALGFVLGGILGQQWGWRAAFLAVGLPGILVALVAWWLPDPPRGRFDGAVAHEQPPGWAEALRLLRGNHRYLFTVGGYVAVSFAVGGIGEWFPTLLYRERGFTLAEAGSIAGTGTVVGGLLGTVLGGVIAEALVRRGVKEAFLWTSALSLLPAVMLAGAAMYVAATPLGVLVCITAAQTFLWMYNGPVNTLLVNSTSPSLRVRAFALSIFSIHAFGDVVSPPVIGVVSEATGSLRLAAAVVLIALVVASGVWAYGAVRLGRAAEVSS
jgi:MFS transporter, Spinster family, sphingosine-1-phosphate transporter